MARVIKNELPNFLGWSAKSKIVVIESDDWGTIRMPSVDAFNALMKSGLDLLSGDSGRYNRFDKLESANDLDALFNLLKLFKDSNGSHPVFTTFCLTSNPDFDRIRNDQYRNYYSESVPVTLKRYYPSESVWSHWIDGVNNQLIKPQFHGREHVNAPVWMKLLQQNDLQTRLAFDKQMWGFNNQHPRGISLMASFDVDEIDDLEAHREILLDGLDQFEKLFEYRASAFVPPNGLLHEKMNEVSRMAGICFAYSARLHYTPIGMGKRKRRVYFLGWKNNAGQYSIVRNVFFEPSQYQPDCVSRCLNEIEIAFRWGKPAIISTHRVNYMGGLDPKNRVNGLEKLSELLTSVLKRWPDVEFLSTDQLGERIAGK